jgi:hypothetical protein
VSFFSIHVPVVLLLILVFPVVLGSCLRMTVQHILIIAGNCFRCYKVTHHQSGNKKNFECSKVSSDCFFPQKSKKTLYDFSQNSRFSGGSIWKPPPANFYTQGMPDELMAEEDFCEPNKGALSLA